ncbi:MAG: tetratricopeptide repeat protein [Endomicrobiales bacterium]
MGTFKGKAGVFAAGIVMTALVLELGLRIVGYLQTSRADMDGLREDKGKQVILCLGDSFVFGVGAPAEKSYPSQLEEMLNNAEGKEAFRVVNMGVQGQNTAQLLETLPQHIKIVQPRAIVILSGGANLWNYWGYYAYLKKGSFASFINENLYRVRAFKLAKLVLVNIEEKKEKMRAFRMSRFKMEQCGQYNTQALEYLKMGKYEKAVSCFRKVLEIDPNNPENYYNLGQAYIKQEEYEKALQAFMQGVRLNPGNEKNRNYNGMAFYLRMHRDRLDGKLVDEAQRFLLDLSRRGSINNPLLYSLLNILGQPGGFERKIGSWLMHDFERATIFLRKEGIPVVLMTYPENNGVNHIVRAVADEQGALLVDNEKVFIELKQHAPRERYFIEDGHCNAEGYGVMARNICEKIREITGQNGQQKR